MLHLLRYGSLADRLRAGLSALSLALALCCAACYALRPDACAAVTLVPPWVWAAPGLLLAGLGVRRNVRGVGRRVFPYLALCAWLLYLAAFTEELPALLRRPAAAGRRWDAARAQGRAVRVACLNCAAGSGEAMAETAAFRPDLVLLQESPGRPEVERFCRTLFGGEGGYAWGVDGSVLARGKVDAVPLPPEARLSLTLARVRLPVGVEMAAGSLRLAPPLVRFDLWSPPCWREQADNRRARREQMAALAEVLWGSVGSGHRPDSPYSPHSPYSPNFPLVLGGDFNAPAGDAVVRLLLPELHDTYREGGIGWGDTVLNELPILRFDQVWASRHFRAVRVFARRSVHSDHRLVVCDLVLEGGGE